jgi:hypothetical protein
MDLVVAILIEWLALNTDIKLNNFPRVEVVRHSDIVEMSGMNAQGLYNWDEQKIYISNFVDLTTIQGVSIVLHELVHHHQNVSGMLSSYECKNQAEQLAYETQKHFLQSMKATLTLEMNPLHVALSSACAPNKNLTEKQQSENLATHR